MNTVHTVQQGESPGRIAQKYTGDAKRAHELVHANAQKPWTNDMNGKPTFTSLHIGEQLHLPRHWPKKVQGSSIVGMGQLPTGWSFDPTLGWVYVDPNPQYAGWAYVWVAQHWQWVGTAYGSPPPQHHHHGGGGGGGGGTYWGGAGYGYSSGSSAVPNATAVSINSCTNWSQPFGTPQRKAEIAASMSLPVTDIKVMTKFDGELTGDLIQAGAALLTGSGGQPVAAQLEDQNTYLFNQGPTSVLVQQCLDAGMVHGLSAPPQHMPPHIDRITALVNRHRAMGLGDAGSVNQEIGTLQGQVNTAPFQDSDGGGPDGTGSYSSYIQAVQAAGNAAATALGPDIDATYGIVNTGTYTQNAWGINGSLAAVTSDTTSGIADAGQAQGYLAQMLASYNQAVAQGQAAQGGGGGGGQPANVVSAAQAASDAINADSNYCTSVGKGGSAVNTAVHNFKMAWNAANPGGQLKTGTGKFDSATAAAIVTALGSGPNACGYQPPPPPPHNQPTVTCANDPVQHPAGYVCPPVPPKPPAPTPVGNLVKCADGTMVTAGTTCPSTMNWLPWVVGGVAVAGGIALVVYMQRQKQHQAATTPALPPHKGTEGYGYESSRYMRHY